MVQIVSTVNLNAIPGPNYNPRVAPASGVGPFAQQEFSGAELEKIRQDPILSARIEAASQRLQPAGYSDNYKNNARLADARQAYNLATRDYKTFLKQEIPAYLNNPAVTQQIVSKLAGLGESQDSIIRMYQAAAPEKDRYAKTESQIYDERMRSEGGILKQISPVISVGLSLFAPGIGSAVGTALGLTGTAAAIVGSAIVQGVLSESQGGDFMDGAIRGAVGAGVAPAVAQTVGQSVASVMADSAFKNVVANTIASSASSAVTAALTGGDVSSAAMTGALAGGAGSVGGELGGETGAQIGRAAGAIAGGVDPTQAILSAVSKSIQGEAAPTDVTKPEKAPETPVSPPPGAEITTAQPPQTPEIVDTGVMGGVAETIPEITPPSPQEISILDQITQELAGVPGGIQEGIAETIPPEFVTSEGEITEPAPLGQLEETIFAAPREPQIPGIQEGMIEGIPEDFGEDRPTFGQFEETVITAPREPTIPGIQEGMAMTIPEEIPGIQEGMALTIPEEIPGIQEGMALTIPEEIPGIQEGMAEGIPEEIPGIQEGMAEGIPEPYTPNIYISGGRRPQRFGPTVRTLGQALAPPLFPSAPVSGLTSYRGAGEIESQKTGKPRRNVWNEASLRLKDALGL